MFDDIHLGHKHLIATAVGDVRVRDMRSLLMTFSLDPIVLFTPDRAPPALSTVSRRAELAEAEGTDVMLVIPFDGTFSSIPAEDFVRIIVYDKLDAQAVFVGQNFAYGRKALGTAEVLPKHGRKCRVDATIADPLDVAAADSTERVSSTHIRGLLADGAVSAAASCLRCPHRVDDDVIPGQGRGGAQLGFPTANIDFAEGLAIPVDGVYAAWFAARPTTAHPEPDPKGDIEFEVRYPAAVSVGANVTFGDADRMVKAYVIDRYTDLYGTAGQVGLVGRVRGMEKFDSVEELIDQINQDVADTEAILAKTN